MSASHVPATQQHPFFHRPSTRLGKRALKWLGWSVALFVTVVVSGWVEEGVFGRGHHAGVLYDVFGLVWLLGLWTAGGLAAASMAGSAIAIIRRGERSWVAFAMILPALLIFLLFAHPLFIND